VRRRLLLGTAVVAVLTLVSGTAVYLHLNGNLRSDDLFAGDAGDAGTASPDAHGRTPLNILVIGSDTRLGQINCQLGGGCEGGANADVQMVVHVAADRSNATVMSVPRDTVTDLPACKGRDGSRMPARRGQINATLTHGPGCTVAAVHKLTGIPIDHFVMVDFAGVIAMSDAVGGATVCVSDDVYDTYSQLKLAKGTHTLKGLAALHFVRSRHGFGDGSDLGRTYAQHLFLSAVIRSVKSAGTLANPKTLYSLADAATKALTVDKDLASIPSLLALAAEINGVPTERITFTTMQNHPDPTNPARVVPAPAARALFAAIANDQPLTAPEPAPSVATSSPAPVIVAGPSPAAGTVARSRIAVRVRNGSGRHGRATAIVQALVAQGFSRQTSSFTSTSSADTTTVRYGPEQQAAAQAVAAALGLPVSALQQEERPGLVLVIGKDWTAGTTYSAPSGAPAQVSPETVLADAHARTADQSQACAQVSPAATVLLNGATMSPARAYALSTGVRDSAP
jgi:LCP family protein required for cell wall assembly